MLQNGINIKSRLDKILSLLKNPLPSDVSLVDVLEQYSNLYGELRTDDKKAISQKFWNRICEIGTPFIEEVDADNVEVHFLFPREEYNHNEKILYIAGDFHGFGSTNDKRQLMSQFGETDIMYRSDIMPKESVVTYHYLQVDPEFADKDRPYFSGPTEALPKTFYPKSSVSDEYVCPTTSTGQDPFKDSHLADRFSKHKNVPMTAHPIFCANENNDLSSLGISPINWRKLFSPDSGHRSLKHKATYLSDLEDNFIIDTNINDNYNDKLFKDHEHTRAVSVFEPVSGKVENLVVICDGTAYMGSNCLDFIDQSIQEGQLPKNTAVVFVTVMPGLLDKYGLTSDNDPRAIEFGKRVDDFAEFLNEKIILDLEYESVAPENRTIVGSSLAGAASLYIGLEHEDIFGKVISQAVGPYYREILEPSIARQSRVDEDFSERIQLSCGRFDSLEHAQNLYLPHTEALAEQLGSTSKGSLPIQLDNYGHAQFQRWSQAVNTSLKTLYKKQAQLDEGSSLHRESSGTSPESKSLLNLYKVKSKTLPESSQKKKIHGVEVEVIDKQQGAKSTTGQKSKTANQKSSKRK